MSNKRKSQRVAAAGKGQLWLSAEGVDAAIWAYRKAMLSDGRAYVVIRELMFLGDFARELGRKPRRWRRTGRRWKPASVAGGCTPAAIGVMRTIVP